MAQEDKGLVLRGLLLLTFVGGLAAFVLALLFWRNSAPSPRQEQLPEFAIASLVTPSSGGFPSQVPWPTLAQLSQQLPSEPGWNVRYNAAAALARRGSAEVPWPILREMLDEKQQLRNQGVRLPDGSYVHDEVTAHEFMIAALKAIAAWHEKQPANSREVSAGLREVYASVDALAESPHLALKTQAEKTRGAFFR
jgi:hypothetical protein